MRTYVFCLAVLAMGCSSSSSGSGPIKSADGGSLDAGSSTRTVCEPPLVDAGVKDAEKDGKADGKAEDAGVDASPEGGEAGPAPCAKDSDCPAGDICETVGKTCVMNVGTTFCSGEPADGGGAPGTCSANPSDMCCSTTTGCVAQSSVPGDGVGGGSCCPGTGGDAYCQGKLASTSATCGARNLCTTCNDTCINANLSAYARFVQYQIDDCGCVANGACYGECHEATSAEATSACGMCLAAQSQEGLGSTCTLAAASDCSNDPNCTAYQACAGMCPM